MAIYKQKSVVFVTQQGQKQGQSLSKVFLLNLEQQREPGLQTLWIPSLTLQLYYTPLTRPRVEVMQSSTRPLRWYVRSQVVAGTDKSPDKDEAVTATRHYTN